MCVKENFRIWCRYPWEAQKPRGKGKESQAFVCRHIISKINTQNSPLCLSSYFCLLSAEHFRFSWSVIYSPFQHKSFTSGLQVPVREMRTSKHVIALLITWQGQPKIVLWSFWRYAMGAECVFVPVTKSTKILLSESWTKYCPWKHMSVSILMSFSFHPVLKEYF